LAFAVPHSILLEELHAGQQGAQVNADSAQKLAQVNGDLGQELTQENEEQG
jgi:hypothetical protein